MNCNGNTQLKDGTWGPCGSVFCLTCGPDEDPFAQEGEEK